MPRSARVQYAGAVYHVMCRGDRREPIFDSDRDRREFLRTLGEACKRAGFLVHSYVLMSNHYHLLLETPSGNLVSGMKWFQGTYTQRYNLANGKSGHLFQGRYKAIPVDSEEAEYFRVVSDYIHLNPARAGLLHADGVLESYEWSSYPAFTASRALPFPWLARARVFSCHDLAGEGKVSRRRYAKYMGLKVKELEECADTSELTEQWKMLRRGWYCGGEGFRDWLMERADAAVAGKKRASFEAAGMRGHDEKEACGLLCSALKTLEIGMEDLRAMRQSDARKQAVAWWIKSRTVVGDAWICRELQMGNRVNVSRAVKRYRQMCDAESRKYGKMFICTD